MGYSNIDFSQWHCDFSREHLKELYSANPRAEFWFDDLHKILPMYEITTPKRVALFLAQTGHESQQYKRVIENLNYSQSGLLKTFKKYFPTVASTNGYVGNPERIANRVYANRLGNGNEASGEGYKFRGRGLIQVTGKYNYGECSKFLYDGDPTVLWTNPSLLTTVEGAIHSACWYWSKNNLNWYAERSMVTRATEIVNGGRNGLEDRLKLWNKALSLIKATNAALKRDTMKGYI